MVNSFTISDTINTLEAIFEKHKNERVCVLATTCTGKTTIIKQIPYCVDVDVLLGECMTAEEITFCGQVPWTEEIGTIYDKIMFERIKIQQGQPLFCSVILECEAVVFLDIPNRILTEHCKKRNVDFDYALQLKSELEKDWNNHKERGGKQFYYVVMCE